MARTNRTAGSNPSRSASKSLGFLTFPDQAEESYKMRRNVRALARGVNYAAKERRRGEPHSTPFRGIFSGARWRSPDCLRNDDSNFARIPMSGASHAQRAIERLTMRDRSGGPGRGVAISPMTVCCGGTLSPTLRSEPAALKAYFVGAFQSLPKATVRFGEQLIRVYGDTAINTGYYTFSYTKDGETKSLPARYSFTYVKDGNDWMLLNATGSNRIGRLHNVRRSRCADRSQVPALRKCAPGVRHVCSPHLFDLRCRRPWRHRPSRSRPSRSGCAVLREIRGRK
jgi:hypothetical protein